VCIKYEIDTRSGWSAANIILMHTTHNTRIKGTLLLVKLYRSGQRRSQWPGAARIEARLAVRAIAAFTNMVQLRMGETSMTIAKFPAIRARRPV
jgi:CHASE1-domain containing sensor protein